MIMRDGDAGDLVGGKREGGGILAGSDSRQSIPRGGIFEK